MSQTNTETQTTSRIFLVPLTKIKSFLQYLTQRGHDIDVIDNAMLENEWIAFTESNKQGK